ncbi:MAG: hypothetical protein GX221_02060 [Candidatus Riflebacteria bacterium]|nr:hypothetical protein [Candidatus Riflebacteria bacterium]
MKRINLIIIILLLAITSMPAATFAETSTAPSIFDRAKSKLHELFNMDFLDKMPVIFHKKSFNQMKNYSHARINNLNHTSEGVQITRNDLQNDKALHITKSADLALHIKSLTGSSLLGYGGALFAGLVKELIDSSPLNPNGERSKEDFMADIVGAKAVFGQKAFDKALDKYLPHLLTDPQKGEQILAARNARKKETGGLARKVREMTNKVQSRPGKYRRQKNNISNSNKIQAPANKNVTPFDGVSITETSDDFTKLQKTEEAKERLNKEYIKAIRENNTKEAQRLLKLLNSN